MDIKKLIGKTEKEGIEIAKSHGYTVRLIKKDGESFVVTMDFRFDRINIEVENDIITKCNLG